MISKDYYLGLDIGTNSIGWAVTDKDYNLVRAKGKDLWGIRLFEEAKTSSERRVQRSARRRTDRKKARIQLLREIFDDEISKVDRDFFSRMDESKFWEVDKKVNGKYSLFNDKKFTDKEYFEKYPTIFHLRKDLMDGKTDGDIRLYYLAISQMMKRRGHFLFEGQSFNSVPDIRGTIDELKQLLNDESNKFELNDDFFSTFIEIIDDVDGRKTEKNNRFKAIINQIDLDKEQKKQLNSITKLIVSGKVAVDALFSNPDYKDLEIKNIEFEGEKFDQNLEYLEEVLGDGIDLVNILKQIYDYTQLRKVLQDYETISESQVAKYNKHGNDLIKLKELIRKYDNKNNNLYKNIFSNPNYKDNYVNYIGTTNKKGKKITVKKCGVDDFYSGLSKQLKKYCNQDDRNLNEILEEIEKGTFLPKQIVSSNSVIPYQVHQHELRIILEQLVLDYPTFLDKEEDVSKVDKIDLLFKFRIPYFVGPLNAAHKETKNSNTWIVKNQEFNDVSIRPWNFDRVVDTKSCEEEFIRRMTNYCTYLIDQKVLPKSSLLYSEYLVLNELNNLRVNGEKLSIELKNEIFEELFCKFKSVSLKKIKSYLIINNYADKDVILSGLDEDIKSNYKSYIEFKEVLGNEFDRNTAEIIIEWITIHSGSSEVIKDKLTKNFPDLTAEQVKKISSFKYKEWGRFSKKLLCELEGVDIEQGEIQTIIYFLRNSQNNFMQLLGSDYTFQKEIEDYKLKFKNDRISYTMLEDLYISPSVRKMIWQVLQITEEIRKVLGKEPKRIFIEMARGKEDKPERKFSRKNQLIDLYKNIKEESRDWVGEIEGRETDEYRSEKLFLYYTQMGRCMYSGEQIELANLYNENIYDIDHIIPRRIKKDDSIIDNKVLCRREWNQDIKKDKYPLPEECRKRSNLWKSLYDKKLISKTKYERLIRTSQLSEEELAGFISRQLVETRQTTKVVADIFKEVYKDSKVVYTKAKLVSEFRQDFDMLKFRDLNDIHHAHDAYLNIVVGNGYYSKFTDNPLNFIRSSDKKYSLNKLFYNTISDTQGNIVWNREKDIIKVKRILDKPSVLFTKEAYEGKGALFNATIIGKMDYKEKTLYLPLKKDERLQNVSKYGGYSSISGAYFFVVEHTVKGNRVITIEFVPVHLKNTIKDNVELLESYCQTSLGLLEPIIIKEKILMKSLVQVNGFRYTLNGRTNKQLTVQPCHQPFWSLVETGLFKEVLGTYDKSKLYNRDLCEDLDREKINILLEKTQGKLQKAPYKNRINIPPVVYDLDVRDNSLTNLEACKLLNEMLNLIKPTLFSADLSLIGGAAMSGVTLTPKNISKNQEFKIIQQSITGIYEKEVKII